MSHSQDRRKALDIVENLGKWLEEAAQLRSRATRLPASTGRFADGPTH